jgi:hypothetical protein
MSQRQQHEPGHQGVIPISGAEATTPSLMVRRDIMSLTKEELALYQFRLDDILQSQSLESKWQELGILRKARDCFRLFPPS